MSDKRAGSRPRQYVQPRRVPHHIQYMAVWYEIPEELLFVDAIVYGFVDSASQDFSLLN